MSEFIQRTSTNKSSNYQTTSTHIQDIDKSTIDFDINFSIEHTRYLIKEMNEAIIKNEKFEHLAIFDVLYSMVSCFGLFDISEVTDELVYEMKAKIKGEVFQCGNFSLIDSLERNVNNSQNDLVKGYSELTVMLIQFFRKLACVESSLEKLISNTEKIDLICLLKSLLEIYLSVYSKVIKLLNDIVGVEGKLIDGILLKIFDNEQIYYDGICLITLLLSSIRCENVKDQGNKLIKLIEKQRDEANKLIKLVRESLTDLKENSNKELLRVGVGVDESSITEVNESLASSIRTGMSNLTSATSNNNNTNITNITFLTGNTRGTYNSSTIGNTGNSGNTNNRENTTKTTLTSNSLMTNNAGSNVVSNKFNNNITNVNTNVNTKTNINNNNKNTQSSQNQSQTTTPPVYTKKKLFNIQKQTPYEEDMKKSTNQITNNPNDKDNFYGGTANFKNIDSFSYPSKESNLMKESNIKDNVHTSLSNESLDFYDSIKKQIDVSAFDSKYNSNNTLYPNSTYYNNSISLNSKNYPSVNTSVNASVKISVTNTSINNTLSFLATTSPPPNRLIEAIRYAFNNTIQSFISINSLTQTSNYSFNSTLTVNPLNKTHSFSTTNYFKYFIKFHTKQNKDNFMLQTTNYKGLQKGLTELFEKKDITSKSQFNLQSLSEDVEFDYQGMRFVINFFDYRIGLIVDEISDGSLGFGNDLFKFLMATIAEIIDATTQGLFDRAVILCLANMILFEIFEGNCESLWTEVDGMWDIVNVETTKFILSNKRFFYYFIDDEKIKDLIIKNSANDIKDLTGIYSKIIVFHVRSICDVICNGKYMKTEYPIYKSDYLYSLLLSERHTERVVQAASRVLNYK